MKKIILLFILFPLFLNAEHFIGAAGTENGGVAWTLGEIVTITLNENSSQSLTQGFMQPEYSAVTGIFQPQQEDIKINVFPNPMADRLFIEVNGKSCEWTIYNVLGKKVESGILSDNQHIDVSNYTAGYYILTVITPEGSASVKVVK